MLPKPVYFGLLFLVFAYAFWRGRSDERFAAAVAVLATIATRFAISPSSIRYSSAEFGLLVVDSATLLAFVALALRSPRFWPLWVAGLQLTSTLAHLLKFVEGDLLPEAYAAALVFWSYPILLIILIGTWRTSQRRKHNLA